MRRPNATALALGTLVLLASATAQAGGPAEPAPAPAPAPATAPTPAPVPAASAALPDGAWQSLVDSEIELALTDGSIVRGRLISFDAVTVTVAVADGSIHPHARESITAVKKLPATAAAPPPVAPTPVGPAPQPGPDVPPPATQGAKPSHPNPTGWALGGAITGITLGTAALGLAIGADVTLEEGQVPAIPLGAAATVLMAAATPIAIGAGGSARRNGGVRGSVGLRVSAWVLYGLALTDAVVLIGLGVAEIEPPHGVPSSVGFLGFTSSLLASVDSIICHNQAKAKATALGPERPRVGVFVRPARGQSGATFGVRGSF